ncbi:MAG TPA: hypothetical protein PKI14_04365 [Fervidobacterium sp.]|nr:hypothetical protein [Fervidobacterium sp.]
MIKTLLEEQEIKIKKLEEENQKLKDKVEDLRAGQLSLLKHIERLRVDSHLNDDDESEPMYSTATETTTHTDGLTLESLAEKLLIAYVTKNGFPTSSRCHDTRAQQECAQNAISLANAFIYELEKDGE